MGKVASTTTAKKDPTIIEATDVTRDVLADRGLTPEFLAEIPHLVAAGKYPNGQEVIAFRHRVDGGSKDHFAFRYVDQKEFRQSTGTKRVLFNNEVLDDDSFDTVIITEGQIDALSFIIAGHTNAMSIPDGAPEYRVQDIKTKYDYLNGIDWSRYKTVILAFDGDGPGQALRDDCAMIIGRARCKYVPWPKQCKKGDANEILTRWGPEALTECLSRARHVNIPGLVSLKQLPECEPEVPWSTGIEGLDEIWKPSPRRMTILTGIPGNGKTTWITDVVVSLVEHNDRSFAVAIASFEDDVRRSLIPRFIQRIIGKPVHECTVDEKAYAELWIQRHIVFIVPPDGYNDDDEAPTVHWFNEHAAAAAIRHNVRFVIGDPYNEFDHTLRPPDVSPTEYTGVMLKSIRQTAHRYNYHVIIAAHPTKMHKDSKGNFAMPTGYNIADSAHWVNKADNGLTVHRGEGNRVTVDSWKCRVDGLIGTLGHRCFIFRKQTLSYDYDEVETFRPMDG